VRDTDRQRLPSDRPAPATGGEGDPGPRNAAPSHPARGGGGGTLRWVLGGLLALTSGGLARAALPTLVDQPRSVSPPAEEIAAGAPDPVAGRVDRSRDDGTGDAPPAPEHPPEATEDLPVFASAPAMDEGDPPAAAGPGAARDHGAADPDPEDADRASDASAPARQRRDARDGRRADSRARRGSGDWRPLLAAGASSDAWVAARNVGPAEAAKVGRPSELLVLADAARRAGESHGAADVYEAIRERFPGHPAAAVSAYRLGRIAFGQGRFREAASWFHTYVGEVGAGERLAADARGRELEALHRAGDEAGARQAATVYLQRYPTGPYARLARELLDP